MEFILWAIKFNLRLAAIVCIVAGIMWLFQDKTVEKKEFMRVKVGKTYITLDKEDAIALKAIDDEIQRQKDAEWADIDDEYKYKDEDGNWYFRVPEEYYKKVEEREKKRIPPPVYTEKDLIASGYALELSDTVNNGIW